MLRVFSLGRVPRAQPRSRGPRRNEADQNGPVGQNTPGGNGRLGRNGGSPSAQDKQKLRSENGSATVNLRGPFRSELTERERRLQIKGVKFSAKLANQLWLQDHSILRMWLGEQRTRPDERNETCPWLKKEEKKSISSAKSFVERSMETRNARQTLGENR